MPLTAAELQTAQSLYRETGNVSEVARRMSLPRHLVDRALKSAALRESAPKRAPKVAVSVSLDPGVLASAREKAGPRGLSAAVERLLRRWVDE